MMEKRFLCDLFEADGWVLRRLGRLEAPSPLSESELNSSWESEQ